MTYFVRSPEVNREKDISSAASSNNPHYWTVWREDPVFVLGVVVAVVPEERDAKQIAKALNLIDEMKGLLK